MSGRPAVTAAPLARLIEAFHRLPGIGPKSAQRLAYHILRGTDEEARELSEALLDVKASIVFCATCQNVTQHDPCPLCADTTRDRAMICVVEEPLDILAIERAGAYSGLYHVLHGSLNPMDGIGPEHLKVRELFARLGDNGVEEVVLATNASLEGEATASYLARMLQPLGVRVTRLAHGLPVGSDVEYADERTLSQAMEHRIAVGDPSGPRDDGAAGAADGHSPSVDAD
jgi:recombination protein RecR